MNYKNSRQALDPGRMESDAGAGRGRFLRLAPVAAAVALVMVASALAASPAVAEPATPGSAFSNTDAAADAAAVEQILRGTGAVNDLKATAVTAPRSAPLAGPDAARDSALPTGALPLPTVTKGAPVAESTASVSLADGLTVPSGASTVGVVPIAAGDGRALSPGGLAVYENTADSSFALSTGKTGANAGYAVISAQTAPTEYRFAFTVDGQPATLRPTDGGGVEVLSATGDIVNSIAPAWATDAAGVAVPTSYSVQGNVLVQRVDHRGASYPVVADPRLACDAVWCTLLLSRYETRLLAAHALSPGIACRFLGAGAGVCAALLIGGWAQANIVLATGRCTGVRVWRGNMVSFAQLVSVGCYA
ncbi:hypothetical protein HD599_002300 [Conyzicola lurida]|uniref:Uncharacterized protein n=1 Tax=Conyzicola lurida TaxID=1172621 RepID=A0A841AL69_9MICO|nr:hypothetical protein [Conyzicola lurida]MBB5843977.1 hypothetical protein [Conyzicola lurida]